MKTFYTLLLFLLVLASATQGQTTYTVETVPDPKKTGSGYVSDPDKILSEEDIAALNQLIRRTEESTSAQIAVVMLNSIGEANPKDFATRLFNLWGIGQEGKDNGLLILTVMDQRRTEFEVGYGLEGILPDALCYRVGMQQLVPSFRDEKYGEGLLKAISRFKEIMEAYADLGEGAKFVMDEAELLEIDEKIEVSQIVDELRREGKAQIIVVTMPTILDKNAEDIANVIFEKWKEEHPDEKKRLLIFMTSLENRLEVRISPDLEEEISPEYFKLIRELHLDYYHEHYLHGKGLTRMLRRMKQQLDGELSPGNRFADRVVLLWRKTPLWLLIYIFANLGYHFFLGVILFVRLTTKEDLADKYNSLNWALAFSIAPLVLFPIPYLLVHFYIKRLAHKLRYGRRFSKKNGMEMFLLSEEEEDEFMSTGQVTEEEIGVADYDVWSTKDHSDTLVLRYGRTNFKYSKCPKCGYKTYATTYTKTLKSATYERSGTGERKKQCKSCAYSKVETYTIPQKRHSSTSSSSSSSSSWSSSSSSSSSSSWGGGSSGGGGAGVSW